MNALRRLTVCVCVLTLPMLAGCMMSPSQEEMAEVMEQMMTRPEPAPELQQLARFIGTWRNEGKFEMPEEGMPMPASASEDGPKMPESMKGESTFSWAMDGRVVKIDGWHGGPDNSRIKMTEFVAWNPHKKKFRGSYYSDWGETGQTWWSFAEDGQSMTFTGKGIDGHGNRAEYTGVWTFIDERTMEWTMESTGDHGTMTMSGTSKKIR